MNAPDPGVTVELPGSGIRRGASAAEKGFAIRGDLALGDRKLVAGLDLNIAGGRWNALLGASGLGKTSLGRLIAGLPTEARLESADQDGCDLLFDTLRAGLMAQTDQLLPWATALANVAIGSRLRGERPDRERAFRLLARVGLDDVAGRRPDTLSAGQRQRVALARTLYENHPVVILDEPFSALDVLARHRMQDLAVEQLAGRTVILITHDPAEAVRLADRAWILRPDGARQIALPESPAPRPVGARETLSAQAALFQLLAADSPGWDVE